MRPSLRSLRDAWSETSGFGSAPRRVRVVYRRPSRVAVRAFAADRG